MEGALKGSLSQSIYEKKVKATQLPSAEQTKATPFSGAAIITNGRGRFNLSLGHFLPRYDSPVFALSYNKNNHYASFRVRHAGGFKQNEGGI